MDNITYCNELLTILDNFQVKTTISDDIIVNLYLTLFTLNNYNYHPSIHDKELDVVEDFLRKVNNLKVKIQLRRKENEIESLYNEIKEMYNCNRILINYYNPNNLSIMRIITSKDPIKLTTLIDNLTKEKIKNINYKSYYENLRNNFFSIILDSPCYIKDNQLSLINNPNLNITLREFYHIFNYLLDINNYPKTYNNDEINKLHHDLINTIIKNIQKKSLSDMSVIPLVLTYLLTQKIPNYESIPTDKFNIDNIKITDLYSFANQNKDNPVKKLASWKNITIPNEYLYQKIKELTKKGMYYFKDNKFIIQNIENNTSDFKISIPIDEIKIFLKDNLLNIINQSH